MIDLRQGDALTVLRTLKSESVNCVICSPPYWGLRDYGTPSVVFGGDPECDHEWTSHVKPAANGLVNNVMQGDTLSGTSATRKPTTSDYCAKCGAWRGQLGLEPTFAEFLAHMVEIFEECRRVLRNDGTCWVNMGDSYSASGSAGCTSGKQGTNVGSIGKPDHRDGKGACLPSKNLIGQPWRLAFALQDAGWWLRSDIIWHKPNPMPESVRDRPTRSHEYIFLLTKSAQYWYDADAIKTQPTDQHPSALDWSRATLEPDRPGQSSPQKRAGRGYKTPDGWDTSTGEGGHGSIHKEGREKGRIITPDNYKGSVPGRDGGPGQERRSRKDRTGGKNEASIDQPGSACRRVVGLNERYDEREAQGVYDNRGANARTVWTIATQGYPDAHFATFPEELPKRCILAGCPEGGTVLDIFAGSGTSLAVAVRLGRKAIGIELNESYCELARRRIAAETPSLFAGLDD